MWSLDYQNPYGNLGIEPCAYNLSDGKMGGRDRVMFHIHWPAILAYLAKFQLNETSCLKQKIWQAPEVMSKVVFFFFLTFAYRYHPHISLPTDMNIMIITHSCTYTHT